MQKQIYLTIDDAPSKDFKKKIEFLYEKSIPAIFFCIGENLIIRKEEVACAIRKGFVIGNHSYNHKHFSDLTIEEAKESIAITDDLIDEIYKISGIQRPIKVFRFPYFDQGGDESGEDYEKKWDRPESEWFLYSRNDRRLALQTFLKELGYVQPEFKGLNLKFFKDKEMLNYFDVRCTFDQMEYYLDKCNAPYGMEKEEVILGRIDEDIPYDGRTLNCLETSDIILLHDHERTTELFYKIINKYIKKEFVYPKLM